MKIKELFGLLVVTTALLADARAQDFLTNGLVAYYPFDGNANDASGNGNNGTVQGAIPANDRFGVTNRAYRFDGVSSLIQFPDTLFDPAVEAVTISAWITTDNGPYGNSTQVILETDTTGGEMQLLVVSGKIAFGPDLASSSWNQVFAPMRSNSVMHLVGVYQRGQSVTLYINGVLANSASLPDEDLKTLSGYALQSAIGAYNYTFSPYQFFRGIIDDVRIYDRALSSSEVGQLYAFESGIPCPPHRAAATAVVTNGLVEDAIITDSGCGYTNTPLVLIQGGGGTGATATAVVSNGVVIGITITNPGVDYTNTPTIYIYGLGGFQVGLAKAVTPTFSDLVIGTNYQLQVSGDMQSWTNQGTAFMATNAVMRYPGYFDVDSWSQLFFRLQVVP